MYPALYVCLSVFCSVCMSFAVTKISSLCLWVCLLLFMSVFLFVCPSVLRSYRRSVLWSVCQSIFPSPCILDWLHIILFDLKNLSFYLSRRCSLSVCVIFSVWHSLFRTKTQNTQFLSPIFALTWTWEKGEGGGEGGGEAEKKDEEDGKSNANSCLMCNSYLLSSEYRRKNKKIFRPK